ncbi:MAG: phenylalanine--tRNA ligase subunit beta, partial [Candidatus Dadabacteria bacterium]|nr:phenylalanine--tRNA ligase subunit beta [Candidatus Dadabacteria bacterium]
RFFHNCPPWFDLYGNYFTIIHTGRRFFMKTTVKWLKEYVDFDLSPQEIAETLTMAGLEVESLTHLLPDNVVAARVEDVSPHPNADRLSLCSVSDGSGGRKIVCGASNMKAGDAVVLALPGARLPETAAFPEGLTIKKAKIRGCESDGMLCSEAELGLTAAKSDGIMILPGAVAPGTPLADIADLEDTVIEIAVTPNRPDCLSVTGIAREVAAATGGVLKVQNPPPAPVRNESGIRPPVIDNTDACSRYCLALVSGVKVETSPLWLRARLSACGIKPVNNIVDITNLVMLETGQPLHAFDRGKLKAAEDGCVLSVRNAKKGESLLALDSQKYDLSPHDLVIADGAGPVAIAGIMGGEESAVSGETRDVLLEAACFSPPVVRRSSKRLKLSSESSYRFERGVDPAAPPPALARAAELMLSVAGGSSRGMIADVCPEEVRPLEIDVSLEKVWKTLGADFDREETANLLSALGFEVNGSGDPVRVKIPTFRPDVSRPADVAEEIARLFGYDAIEEAEPGFGMLAGCADRRAAAHETMENVFVFAGFSEAVNYGFENPDLLRAFSPDPAVEILNPISRDLSVMRNTMLAGLMKNLKFNLSRQLPAARLFETGKVFFHKGSGQLPREERMFAAVAAGAGDARLWEREGFDFFDMKGLAEKTLATAFNVPEGAAVFESGADKPCFHPGKSARIAIGGETIGNLGEIHPETARAFELEGVVALELNLEKLYALAGEGGRGFSPLPKFPSLRRDVAFVVKKEIEAGSMVSGVRGVSPLVERVWIFDLFEDKSLGDGMKSVGISMVLRSAEKTLTDEDANLVCEKAVKTLGDSFGARVRQ